MDADESVLFAATLREVLAGPAESVDAQLSELGWEDVVDEDPATATTLLFTEQGRSLAATALLDRTVLRILAKDLPAPATAVVYPALAGGRALSSTASEVSGVVLRRPAPGSRVAVPVAGPDGPQVVVVSIDDLQVTDLTTFDPSLTWCTVTGPVHGTPVAAPSWPDALAAAHLALAAELIAVAGEVLRLAVEHTSSRFQFGAPIAAFQAVRHRLADSHVAIAAAKALLEGAWENGTPLAATAAKAQAGRAHEEASGHALQVTGAMGSTYEHPLHTFVSRGAVLDALLGGWNEQVRALGQEILRTGETPRLIEM
ncbi:MAG: acyl-CoA dehydrogenase protein [Frankiales bacterium]|nr:acyl-CoA dehydrogenase protein [Frankiales bacterium]